MGLGFNSPRGELAPTLRRINSPRGQSTTRPGACRNSPRGESSSASSPGQPEFNRPRDEWAGASRIGTPEPRPVPGQRPETQNLQCIAVSSGCLEVACSWSLLRGDHRRPLFWCGRIWVALSSDRFGRLSHCGRPSRAALAALLHTPPSRRFHPPPSRRSHPPLPRRPSSPLSRRRYQLAQRPRRGDAGPARRRGPGLAVT